jgi:uncharacterized membrane protein
MDLRALNRGELLAILGAVLIGISVFLPWYSLGDQYTQLNGCHGPGGSCTGWQSLLIVRFLLLAAAAAPLILSWIIIRGHALSWPRGELTAVVGVAALILVLFRGVIDKPGSPADQITVDIGWWVALVGTLLLIVGAAWRRQEGAPRRNPPGVL